MIAQSALTPPAIVEFARAPRIAVGPELELHAPPMRAERPIFHDLTGRRAHYVRGGAGALALACAAWIAILVAGILGPASLPALSAQTLSRGGQAFAAQVPPRTYAIGATHRLVASRPPLTSLHVDTD